MVFIHFFIQILLAVLAFNLAIRTLSADEFVIAHLVMGLNQSIVALIHLLDQWLRKCAAIPVVFAFESELKSIDHMVHLC